MKKTQNIKIELESDYVLIGIVSSENDYKLSWLLNKNLNIEFVSDDAIEVKSVGQAENLKFALYTYDDPFK